MSERSDNDNVRQFRTVQAAADEELRDVISGVLDMLREGLEAGEVRGMYAIVQTPGGPELFTACRSDQLLALRGAVVTALVRDILDEAVGAEEGD